jgi:hypothetical protein
MIYRIYGVQHMTSTSAINLGLDGIETQST